jgi:hypothetical protein
MSDGPAPRTAPRGGCFLCGFGAALGSVLLMAAVLWSTPHQPRAWVDFVGVALLVFGLSQLAYVVPVAIWLAVRRRWRTLAGWLTGAALLFLLNAACFGLFMHGIG